MDESRKPVDAAGAKNVPSKDEGPVENLGVTGVFSTAPEPEPEVFPDEVPLTSGFAPEGATRVLPAARPQAIQEPVVHKVVLPGGPAPATDILERLRAASPAAETPGQAAPPSSGGSFAGMMPGAGSSAPAPAGGPGAGQGSEGFTQLIRALTGEAVSPPPAEQADPRPLAQPGPRASAESEFTSLLRTLHAETAVRQKDEPVRPPGATSSRGQDGFTALIKGFEAVDADVEEARVSPPAGEFSGATGAFVPPATPAAAQAKNEPGTLTRFFSGLESDAVTPAAANPTVVRPAVVDGFGTSNRRDPVAPPVSDPSSFTQLLISSIQEPPAAGASSYRETRPPVFDDFARGPAPAREDPLRTNVSPTGVSAWGQPTAPAGPPAADGAGLTQLLRNLSEGPASSETARPYSGGGDSPTQPISADAPFPASRKAEYSPTPPAYSSPQSGVARPAVGSSWEPVTPVGGAPVNSGPSEVTRILDASKLREIQRPGASGAGATGSSGVPVQAAAPPVQPPAPAGIPWPQMPVAPAPGVALQFPPPMVPPVPQYTPPAAPQIAAPAPQSAPVTPPAMGKMQQYLPLLLILIIFLLVVILVTVVFLLKH